MKKFHEYLENKKPFKTITIICRDNEDSLENLLQYIRKSGNIGHSFSIIVDPKSDGEKSFGWDGDGSDYIKDIKVDK